MATKEKISIKSQPDKEKGKPEGGVVLTLQGEITLDYAPKIKDFFSDNLKKYQHFTLRVSNVDSIDLGAVQLMQRFIWDAQAENKKVDLSLNLSPDIKILLERSVFNSFLALSK